jgi:hypothetical protein
VRVSTKFALPLALVLLGILLVPRLALAQTSNPPINCPVEPAQNVPIASGNIFAGSNCVLHVPGDVDSFQFSANNGDTWRLVAAEVNEVCNEDIGLALYDPNMVLIYGPGYTNSCGGGYSVATDQTLTTTGLYTMVVTEAGSAGGTRTYGVSLERLYPFPPDALQLTLGQQGTGITNPLIYQNAFTWAGVTTGTYRVTATMTPSGCTIDLCITAYDPDGTTAAYQCTNSCAGIYTIQFDFTPPQNGALMAFVGQVGDNVAFSYTLDVSCLVGDCTAISSLSPSSATAGGPGFNLTVNGSGFLSGATVQWNGSGLATTYVSGNQLIAAVPSNLIAAAASAAVVVVNPGGLDSNTATFTINPPPPPATITSPTPGITLSDSLADFTWTAVSGATEYQLCVGTTPGGTNIFCGTTTGTSQIVDHIPCTDTVGGPIYVELAAEVNGGLQPATDYAYTCELGLGDFNGDGHQDLVWQNNSTGQVTVQYYGGTQGATFLGWNWLNESGEASGWVLVGAADFDGNGVPDLVWESPTGQVTVNYYGGTGGATYLGWNWLNEAGVPGWTVVAVADMNNDGVPDLIWENKMTNQVTVNYYGGAGGAVYQGWNWLNSAGEPVGWRVVAAADFDGNGTPDLVWQYAPTRQVAVNYYGGPSGATYLGWNWLNEAGAPGWTVVGANDFTGDGVPDLVWQNDTTFQVTVNYYGGPGGASYLGWNWLTSSGYPGWTAVVPR